MRFAEAHGLYGAPRLAGNFEGLSSFHDASSTRQGAVRQSCTFLPLKKRVFHENGAFISHTLSETHHT